MNLRYMVPPVLLAMQLILPLCRGLGYLTEMKFTLHDPVLFQLAVTCIFVAVTVVLMIKKVRAKALYLLIFFAAVADSVLWLAGGNTISLVLAVANVLCAVVLVCSCAGWVRTVALFLCVPAISGVLFIGAMSRFFSGWAVDTVMNQVKSPSGEYVAMVVDSNQGAMGGNTLVQVQRQDRIEVLVGAFNYPAQRVYLGQWGEWETLQLYWKDDQTLVINGKEYHITI